MKLIKINNYILFCLVKINVIIAQNQSSSLKEMNQTNDSSTRMENASTSNQQTSHSPTKNRQTLTSSINFLKNCGNDTEKFAYFVKPGTKIAENVFASCKKLTSINLGSNQLTSLYPDIFKHNYHVKTLDLSKNNFTSVNPQWFQSCAKSLRNLDLSFNKLKVFPGLLEITGLKRFYIGHNLLHDINETLIISKFDILKHFSFSFNQIGCTRHTYLISYFEGKSITTEDQTKDTSVENTTCPQQGNFGCIDDGCWDTLKVVYMKDNLIDEMIEIRDSLQQPSIHVFALYGICLIITLILIVQCVWLKRKIKENGSRAMIHNFNAEIGEYYESNEFIDNNATNTATEQDVTQIKADEGNEYQGNKDATRDNAEYAIVEKRSKSSENITNLTSDLKDPVDVVNVNVTDVENNNNIN